MHRHLWLMWMLDKYNNCMFWKLASRVKEGVGGTYVLSDWKKGWHYLQYEKWAGNGCLYKDVQTC